MIESAYSNPEDVPPYRRCPEHDVKLLNDTRLWWNWFTQQT